MDILLLTDYKGFYSSKQKSTFYRGGLDLKKLKTQFEDSGFSFNVLSFSDLNNHYDDIIDKKPIILYQSSEDKNNYYKSFIEDVVYDLEQSGIEVIPGFEYLKAHNNKVAMELLRRRSDLPEIKSIRSNVYGVLEEIKAESNDLEFPLVLKPASGSMSKGVKLIKSKNDLIKSVKSISSTKVFFHDLKELLRTIKYHKKYKRESFYRRKFITQNLISGLDNDYKVLVYWDKCYILYRGVREGDFRASGSGNFEFRKEIPDGILDYAHCIREKFDVPHISLDVAFDGEKFHTIEFQFIMFGTTTLEKADFYFQKSKSKNWELVNEKSNLEDVYTYSVIEYLKR